MLHEQWRIGLPEIGLLAGMAAVLILFSAVLATKDSEAQTQPRVAYVLREDFGGYGVYAYADARGCRYTIVRAYSGVAITKSGYQPNPECQGR